MFLSSVFGPVFLHYLPIHYLPLKYVKSVIYSLVPSVDFFCFHHSHFYFKIPFYSLIIFLTHICCMNSLKENVLLDSSLSILSTLTSTPVSGVQAGPSSWQTAFPSSTRPSAPSLFPRIRLHTPGRSSRLCLCLGVGGNSALQTSGKERKMSGCTLWGVCCS